MSFDKNFLWGGASAAAQVEGGWNEDGRTPSIWDVAPAGTISHNDTCHFACDCYHRWKEDVALMKQLGFKSYRFSISWSRVIPAEGQVNPDGIKFYSDFVDELLANGIEPMVTLYHWDLPQWASLLGGWLESRISDLYYDYVRVVAEALGDRVKWWMTFNEPQVFVGLGYNSGAHAPFVKGGLYAAKIATKNVLLAHGKACMAIRQFAKLPAKISMASASTLWTPVSETAEDIEKARYFTFDYFNKVGSLSWWNDPVFLGRIPSLLQDTLTEEDMKIIVQPLDYVALNNYQSRNYADAKADYTDDGSNVPSTAYYPGLPRTSMNWAITPETLYWLIRFVYERYNKPVLISENGMSAYDFVHLDGKVHDSHRTDFITRYIANVKRAADENIPVLGYQYWSLFDNFEWTKGYDPRFGIIYVDYRDGTRILKDSAFAYAEIIRQNGENLPHWEIANKR